MEYITLFNCNRNIVRNLTKCVQAFHRQNYDRGIRLFRELLTLIQQQIQLLLTTENAFQEAGIEVDGQYLVQLLADLLQAQEQQDYILLSDLLELTIEPFIVELQVQLQHYAFFCKSETKKGIKESDNFSYLYSALYPSYLSRNLDTLREIDPPLAKSLEEYFPKIQITREDGLFALTGEHNNTYFLEETQSGFLTARVQDKEQKTFYLHSNKNVWAEADAFAETYVNTDALAYHILGAGLGYHWLAVGEHSLSAKKVHVYETDKTVLIMNLMLHDLATPLRSWLQLHEDPKLFTLRRALEKEPKGFMIHHPSLRKMEQEDLRRSFEKFFITDNSFRNHEDQLMINFQLNQQKLQEQQVSEVSAIIKTMYQKKVVIVAAGPSLDKNVQLLKEKSGDKNLFILATGTVFYKLMKMGIRPDAVIATDSNQRVVYQIREYEKETIPMLLLSTAYWGFAQQYQGPKYLLFQQDFQRAEAFAGKEGYHLFQTGGSVSTTALDVAVFARAKEIIFIGLDLAFTDNLAHASGTSDQLAADAEGLIPIKAYGGGTVLADQKFIIYREWMERRLQQADVKGIKVINATEGGCYLKGAEHRKLSELL